MKNIVIIDNSLFNQNNSKNALSQNDFNIVGTALDGDSGINEVLDNNPDIILIDNTLPDMEGTDVIQILKSEGIEKDVVMIIPQNQLLLADNLSRMGAKDYLVRPFTDEVLLEKISQL